MNILGSIQRYFKVSFHSQYTSKISINILEILNFN